MKVDYCAQLAIGLKGYQTYPGLLGLTQRGQKWRHILPSYTWINVGSHNLFLEDITVFETIQLLMEPLYASRLNQTGHGWYVFADQGKLSAYCALKPEEAVEPGMLPGSEAVVCGLIDIAQHMGFEVMRSDVG